MRKSLNEKMRQITLILGPFLDSLFGALRGGFPLGENPPTSNRGPIFCPPPPGPPLGTLDASIIIKRPSRTLHVQALPVIGDQPGATPPLDPPWGAKNAQ